MTKLLPLVALALACGPTEPTDGGGESVIAGEDATKVAGGGNRPAVHPIGNAETLNYARMTFMMVSTDSALAGLNRGPHVCVTWPTGVCMQCVANKSMRDSVSADLPNVLLPHFDWGFGTRGPTQ